jgi:hypothetical protein
MNLAQDAAILDGFARSHGIHWLAAMDGRPGFIEEQYLTDYQLAMDAQPTLITVNNAGIPAFLTNYMDPKVITVLTTPNKAAEILGEVQKGSWTTRTMTFAMVESTGLTSSYDDWSNAGSTNANASFPARQSFHYQTITQWGQKQLEEAGLAKIDWAQRLNIASALILDKFQNQTYFFGVAGLQNYGLLNDPSLSAAITPGTKVAGGATWAVGTPNEIYLDIQKLFGQLAAQTGGIIGGGLVDQNTKLVLATTPAVAIALSNKNSFGLSVYDMLKSTFPNIRFVTATQYSTTGGNVVQLIAEEIDGQEVGYCAFTEKMRAHMVIADVSSFKQKKSQGSWGTIIFLPLAIAQMVGV